MADDKISREIAERVNQELTVHLEEMKVRRADLLKELESPEAQKVFTDLKEKEALDDEINRLQYKLREVSEAVREVLYPKPKEKSQATCMV